jgi:hypothetical protein
VSTSVDLRAIDVDLPPVLYWCATELFPEILERGCAERSDDIVHDSLSPWGKLTAAHLGVPAICSVAIPYIIKAHVGSVARATPRAMASRHT